MKRIFCLLNAVVFMLLLCSCGKNDVPEDNQSSSGYTEEQTDSAKGTLLKKEPLTIEKVKEAAKNNGFSVEDVNGPGGLCPWFCQFTEGVTVVNREEKSLVLTLCICENEEKAKENIKYTDAEYNKGNQAQFVLIENGPNYEKYSIGTGGTIFRIENTLLAYLHGDTSTYENNKAFFEELGLK